MERLFSTDTVHPRDRFDYWHEVACKTITGHDCRPACRATFQAEIGSAILAEIGLVRFTNSPMAVLHDQRHASQSETDHLFLCRQIAGSLIVEQDGREAVLTPDDMTLLDPRLPYSARFSSGSNLLVIKLPRRALEIRIGTIRGMAARTMTSLDPVMNLTSAQVATLPAHSGTRCLAAEELLKDYTLNLVALSLSRLMQNDAPRASSARTLVMLRVRAVIDSKLGDSKLDPIMVAAAAGVSVRYANSVLADQGTSIARLIQKRRLERCRKALEDPHQAHRSVSDIAYSWGFIDITHFGRVFRKAYGMLPGEARRVPTRQCGLSSA